VVGERVGENAWGGAGVPHSGRRGRGQAGPGLGLLGAMSDASNPSPGGSDFVKRGPGELILAGNNTYRGTTGIDEGILTAMSGTAFGANTAGTVVANGAQLQL